MYASMDARVSRAISDIDQWLGDNCWVANPQSWTSRQHAIMKRKSFAEVALYVYIANQLGESCDMRLYDMISHVVLGSDDYVSLLFRSPGKILLYGTPFVALKVSGDLPESYRAKIANLVTSRNVLGTERLPHRQLDLWHFTKALGLPAPFDGLAASKFGLLGFPPNPILCDSRDSYGLTHNIFYITNFGVVNEFFPQYETDKKDELVRCLNGLSAKVLFEGNVDLLLELAICLLIMTGRHTPISRLIIDHALECFEKEKILNSPDNSDVAEIAQEAPEESHWFRSYHTMSVAAIAFRIFRITAAGSANFDSFEQCVPKDDMLVVGRAMLNLMQYKLLDAASAVHTLNNNLHPDLSHLEDEILSYIIDQQRSNGSYGYFSDEVRMWGQLGGDPEELGAVQYEIDSAITSLLLQKNRPAKILT